MLLTPTYHVFDMYKNHQNATLLDSYLETLEIGEGENKVPCLHESASLDADGKINITICNLSLEDTYETDTELVGAKAKDIEGWILTGDMNGHNTFTNPTAVKKEKYTGFKLTETGFCISLPPRSIVSLLVEC